MPIAQKSNFFLSKFYPAIKIINDDKIIPQSVHFGKKYIHEPRVGIEPTCLLYESSVLPLNYIGLLLYQLLPANATHCVAGGELHWQKP